MALAPLTEGMSTRERLTRAALRLFAERGYAGVSNREIVEACGLTKGAIYWYFESKDHLFRTVVAEALESWEQRVIAAVGTAETPQEQAAGMFRLFIEVLDDHDDPHRDLLIIMTHRQAGPGQSALGHAYEERFVGWVHRVLDESDASHAAGRDVADLVLTTGLGVLVQVASGRNVARPVLGALLRLLGGGELYAVPEADEREQATGS